MVDIAHRAKTTNLDAEVRIVGLGLSHVFDRRRLVAYLRHFVRPTVGTGPQWPRADCR